MRNLERHPPSLSPAALRRKSISRPPHAEGGYALFIVFSGSNRESLTVAVEAAARMQARGARVVLACFLQLSCLPATLNLAARACWETAEAIVRG